MIPEAVIRDFVADSNEAKFFFSIIADETTDEQETRNRFPSVFDMLTRIYVFKNIF